MTRKTTVINALGAQTAAAESATASGGQNYAEVILFDSAPTEAERKACERYLARKWGLATSYQGGMPDGEYRLNSAGANTAVTVVGDVEIAGIYNGALTVDGRSTVSFARELPATAYVKTDAYGKW